MTDTPVMIQAIGTALGADRVDNAQLAEGFGKDGEFLDTRIGTRWLPKAAPGESAVSLALEAAREALSLSDVDPAEIGLLIFVSQNPDHGGLPHNSALLQHALGLPDTSTCFDVGLGCSGFVYGLSIADALMRTQGIDHALLVTSDQYRSHLRPDDPNTSLLFGDAAAATLLSRSGGHLIIEGCELGTDGSQSSALIRGNDGIAMNGRAVFGFSRRRVPAAINSFLQRRGLDPTSMDAVLLHQGSRAIVEEITKELGLDPAKVPVGLEGTGNTVSSSIPVLLKPRLTDPGLRNILVTGFGVGLSWGSALLRRRS